MKQILFLLLTLLLLVTESYGSCRAQTEPAIVNPVINGKTKMAVLIPGKDSVLFTVTNIAVSEWRIKKAPARGMATLNGADARQVWVKFELQSGIYGPDTLTVEAVTAGGGSSVRSIFITGYTDVYQYYGELLIDKIRLEFYNGQSGLYAETVRSNGTIIQGTSYLWPASHLLRAFKNANRVNPAKYGNVLKSYTNAMDRYKSTALNKVGYAAYPGDAGRFYDDNGLMVIQFAEIYKDLKENKVLDQAKIAYLFNHNDRDDFWGLPQHENQLGQGMFYSMAVNQTGLGAALLYELTGISSYLEDAKSYYNQLMNPLVKLRDANARLFHQYTFFKNGLWSYAGTLDGQPVNGQGFRAYQTTHVIQIALKLYLATHESRYLNEAILMMNDCINYWYTANRGLNENSFWGGDDMVDALVDCYEVTADKRFYLIARDIVDYLIKYCRDPRGYYPGDYDDNNGKWNLDRRDELPETYMLMGQAAAASAILRVAQAESTLTAVDLYDLPGISPDRPLLFPTVFSPGDRLTFRFSQKVDRDVRVSVYSLAGRQVFSGEIPVQGNIASFILPSAGTSNGPLVIKLFDGTRVTVHLGIITQ